LVEVLETVGYGVGDIDYVNELGYRESIARAMAAAPSLSDKIGPLIHSLDRRFKDATSPVKRPLGGFLHRGTEIPDDEVNWWYYRYPKKHSRELRADERIGGIEIDEGTA
jgi:hypothetical protein